MRRPEHPLIVLTIEALARRFRVEPADLWDWLDRRKAAPRWFVDAAVEAYFPGLRESDFDVDEDEVSLPPVDNGGTVVENMQTDSLRRRLGRPSTDHPFPRALQQRGVTLAEWAKEHGTSPATVSSWFLGKNARRKIPMSVAQQIEKELGVPLAAWKNGIKYDL